MLDFVETYLRLLHKVRQCETALIISLNLQLHECCSVSIIVRLCCFSSSLDYQG